MASTRHVLAEAEKPTRAGSNCCTRYPARDATDFR